jgi:hypothetical protein
MRGAKGWGSAVEGVRLTSAQYIYRSNTKAKIPLDDEQTPKQWRTRIVTLKQGH